MLVRKIKFGILSSVITLFTVHVKKPILCNHLVKFSDASKNTLSKTLRRSWGRIQWILHQCT